MYDPGFTGSEIMHYLETPKIAAGEPKVQLSIRVCSIVILLTLLNLRWAVIGSMSMFLALQTSLTC
jgi:hypothetical protein